MKTRNRTMINPNYHFINALDDLCASDLFNVNLTNDEKEKIFVQFLKNIKANNQYPSNYIAMRDAVFDAMEDLGYELPED